MYGWFCKVYVLILWNKYSFWYLIIHVHAFKVHESRIISLFHILQCSSVRKLSEFASIKFSMRKKYKFEIRIWISNLIGGIITNITSVGRGITINHEKKFEWSSDFSNVMLVIIPSIRFEFVFFSHRKLYWCEFVQLKRGIISESLYTNLAGYVRYIS